MIAMNALRIVSNAITAETVSKLRTLTFSGLSRIFASDIMSVLSFSCLVRIK